MSICEYVKSKKNFKDKDFLTAYLTIVELIKDGYITVDKFERNIGIVQGV